ncbi:class I adenylate-forming enzyme family protein [Paraburkholderia sp. RL17-337-BIB-A]|uniref:class I adenylate-forming enzyme family protein n=1 Tax=Paraburkholderia sp. RL17-337-BIB-A TaxID=3031636 RepID=UPI0038BAB9AC
MATMPVSRTLPLLLEEQAAIDPEHEAIVGGAVRLTYEELLTQVKQTAAALHALGIGRGDRVAILMGNRPEWLVLAYAAQYLGAIAVGLNTWATARELEYALRHSEASLLVAAATFLRQDFRVILQSLEPLAECLPRMQQAVWIGDKPTSPSQSTLHLSYAQFRQLGEGVPAATIEALGTAVEPSDPALLVYSSGSTAAPKGILLRHDGLIENGWYIGERQHVVHEDRLWLAVSLFWSLGSANAVMNLLTHRGTIVLQESFNAAEALRLIDAESCSVFYGTPNMVRAISDASTPDDRRLVSLRTGATIGTPEQIKRLAALGATAICNVYGLTETYGNCAVTDASEPLEIRSTTMGTPLPGFTVRIVDLTSGAVLPAGQVGEIRIRGRLFAGYYRDPARTAACFDAEGFFCSGDLGLLDDAGRIVYRGRVTEMIKTGGINVAPAEVEETLAQHPAVECAFVVALPDAIQDEVLGAIVIARTDLTVSEETLQVFCRETLSAYKVPRIIRILAEADLPLTTTGKVKKSELKHLFDTAAAGNPPRRS